MAKAGAVGRVFVLRGAIASESHLLEELCSLARAGVGDPGLLRKPVLVLTPSRSLREHLSARLVERHGRAVAGISIQTLDRLVDSILARAGESVASDRALFPALIRQLARSEANLRESLDGLKRGYAPVEGGVSDLLDAGLEPAHADAVIELLGEFGSSSLGKRAEAVVRVAALASEQLEELGIGHLSTRIRRACELLDADPERVLPVRAAFVFGFADATGLQMDLIEMLLRRCGARVYLDHPADPDDSARPDPGIAFSDRFGARMRGAVGVETLDLSENASPAEVRVLRAPGLDAEVRGVANRIREQLDAGVQPERIGVVARNLDLYRSALRSQFRRLGIPFSGVDTGNIVQPAEHRSESDAPDRVAPADRRRTLALQALLGAGSRISVDLWLDLQDALPSSAQRAEILSAEERSDLRVAFHASGIARLADVERFEAGATARLPRVGLAISEDGAPTAPRRKLSSDRIAVAASAALGVSKFLSNWPDRAALSVHLGALDELVTEHLRWRLDGPAKEAFFARFETPVAGDFDLDREDFLLYFDARIKREFSLPIGGAGGGIAVLSVEQARSRTFDRLFVLGLSREVFPRPIGEDPLLPDGLRRRLRAVLPDLPVKREGYDEERYLFAQLLSSSPTIVVSYPAIDEDGRRRPASPLLERLRSASHEDLPGFWQPAECSGSPPLRPAHEHAQIAGLWGTRDQFARALRAAVDEPLGRDPDVNEIPNEQSVEVRTAARIAVLDEWDPGFDRRFELGPYYGFAGSIAEGADMRRAPLYITRVEKLARCAWQAFLTQLLRVEPLPDALAELPSADAMMVGNLVHRVLQKIVTERQPNDGQRLDQVAQSDPVSIPWPEGDQLRDLLNREARALLRAEGIGTPGFERVLINQARACVDVARVLDWPGEASGVGALGIEIEGSFALRDRSGAEREIHFCADRVDRTSDGLRLIDYKTGKAAVEQKQSKARRSNILKNVSIGKTLQTAAYALGGAQLEGGLSSEGRYLYIGADTPEHARISEVDAEDRDCTEAFIRAVQIALDAWDRGSFTPRLIDSSTGKEPRQCGSCVVKEACLRGDSGSRARLEHWVEAARTVDGGASVEAERAALGLWNLGMERT